MEILITFGAAVITVLCSVVAYLFSQMISQSKEIATLRDEHAGCKEDVATLRAQLIATQALAEQARQFGAAGGSDAEIIVDAATGMIIDWSPGAMMLLRWPQREILGKPFLRVIAPRFRDRYEAELREVARVGKLPFHGPAAEFVVTRDGVEVPVEIRLKGWRQGEQYRVEVTLRMREDDGSGMNVAPSI